MDTSPIDRALHIAGGLNSMSARIAASPQTIANWRSRGVPEDRCPAIEHTTDGSVTCEELRPDVSWVRVPDATWPHPEGRPLVDHASKVGAGDTAKEAA